MALGSIYVRNNCWTFFNFIGDFMKTFNLLEVAIEVAWQLKDDSTKPRAESRWEFAQIALDIENAGIIDDTSEDIDEIIHGYLIERGLK